MDTGCWCLALFPKRLPRVWDVLRLEAPVALWPTHRPPIDGRPKVAGHIRKNI